MNYFIKLWYKFSIFFYLRGINLPGYKKALAILPEDDIAGIRRQLIINEIKGSSLFIRSGPIWIRRIVDKIIRYLQRYKYLALLIARLMLSFIVIIVPITIFIVIRGVLPVPERIPYTELKSKLQSVTKTRTDWPYTLLSKEGLPNNNIFYYNIVDKNKYSEIKFSQLNWNEYIPGLFNISTDINQFKNSSFNGFFVSENSPIVLNRIKDFSIDKIAKNYLHLKVLLLSKDEEYRCKLEIRDQNFQIILSNYYTTKSVVKNKFKNILNIVERKIIPNATEKQDVIKNIDINLDELPQKLLINVFEEEQEENELIIQQEERQLAGYKAKDISDNHCIFAVGGFEFERTISKSLNRRGIIMINIDSLLYNTYTNKKVMPNIANFINQGGFSFNRHFAVNNSENSYKNILYSNYTNNITESPTDSIHLKKILEGNGYRTHAIGLLQNSEANYWQTSTVIKNPNYDARMVTEEAGQWLQEYGDNPFFLYLKYVTLNPPFRPPFKYLDVFTYLSSPLSIKGEQELYRSAASYLDHELGLLLYKLAQLNIDNYVDIIFVSLHGIHLIPKPYGVFDGFNPKFKASTRGFGPLMEEEIHVPFFIHLAEEKNVIDVNLPTTHLDILPTINTLIGSGNASSSWFGADLSPFLFNHKLEVIKKILINRKSILLESDRYLGLLKQDKNNPQDFIKYVKQINPESRLFFSNSFPWRSRFTFNVAEIISKIMYPAGNEIWLSGGTSQVVKEARHDFFSLVYRSGNVAIKSFSKINIDILVLTENSNISIYSKNKINISTTMDNEGKFRTIIKGNLEKNDSIVIKTVLSNILKIETNKQNHLLVGCPNAQHFDGNYLNKIFEDTPCLWLPVSKVIAENYYKKGIIPLAIEIKLPFEDKDNNDKKEEEYIYSE